MVEYEKEGVNLKVQEILGECKSCFEDEEGLKEEFQDIVYALMFYPITFTPNREQIKYLLDRVDVPSNIKELLKALKTKMTYSLMTEFEISHLNAAQWWILWWLNYQKNPKPSDGYEKWKVWIRELWANFGKEEEDQL
jgi:hypothetical protein